MPKPLQPLELGRMRSRIRIQHDVALQSASGATKPEWVDFAVVWASIEPAGGVETFQAQQIYPESPTVITVRYQPGIDETMRVLWNDPRTHEDRQFDIKSVTDIEMWHYVLELACIERPIERNA